jgi:hypothetical protein
MTGFGAEKISMCPALLERPDGVQLLPDRMTQTGARDSYSTELNAEFRAKREMDVQEVCSLLVHVVAKNPSYLCVGSNTTTNSRTRPRVCLDWVYQVDGLVLVLVWSILGAILG